MSRHDGSQRPLTLDERQVAEIASIQPQKIEGAEARFAAPKEECVELGTAVLVEAGEFAVQYSSLDRQLPRHAVRQFFEAGELIPIARDQAHTTALQISQRPEAIVLDLEEPICVREWLRTLAQRHRLEYWQ